MKILVRRAGAFGDVLCTTPVVARLRKEYPDYLINIETRHPLAYYLNPHIENIMTAAMPEALVGTYDRVIDLNGAYEKRLRRVHNIDAYMEEAFGDRGGDRQIVFDFNSEAMPPLPPGATSWGRTVVIHAARSWPQRTLPSKWWLSLNTALHKRGFATVFTGTSQDHPIVPMLKGSPRQQAAVINAAACFVGSDSGLMFLAHATKAPIVGLLTMTGPEFFALDRFGVRGWGFHPIVADIECAGCSTLQTENVEYFPCRFGHNKCVESFSVEKVADVVEQAALLGASSKPPQTVS